MTSEGLGPTDWWILHVIVAEIQVIMMKDIRIQTNTLGFMYGDLFLSDNKDFIHKVQLTVFIFKLKK